MTNRIAGPAVLAGALAALSATALVAGPAAPQSVRAFQAACAAKAAAAEKSGRPVRGKNGWLFFGPELRHVSVGTFWGAGAARVSRASRPDRADPLPVILDFKAQLDRAGIELIFVPVPPKAIIYPDAVSEQAMEGKNGPPRFDLHHQRFYTLLRKSGVKVLDLAPDFMARRRDKAGAVYCKQDTHWSGRACVLAAQQIARHVQDRPWRTSPPKAKLAQEWKTVTITGDLWEALGQTALPRETLPLRFVGERTSAGIKPVSPDRASPVLLLGDSHNLIFHSGDDMQARGAGLADQLALEFGFPVDLVAVRGSGATPARVALQRRARAAPNYLANKKLVIWCLSAREFTESAGWQKVPVSTSQAQ